MTTRIALTLLLALPAAARTSGEEIALRDDGGCWDLGYPRTVQRPDGKLVTMYYFNDDPQRERYIAATIWDPGMGGSR